MLRESFNGAATNWSRKFPAYNGMMAEAGALQWGRDQLVAEMTRSQDCCSAHEPLQWGRDQLVAEMIAVLLNGTPAETLQWGRDHLVAEIIQLGVHCWSGAGGFNGAATNWSRNCPE